jgi:ribosomal protein S18 acetylase RimI-like enzyme
MEADRLLIRRIFTEDVDVFRRIRLEALRKEPGSFASHVEDWEIRSNEEWRQRLTDPVFVAINQGQPVGIMGLLRYRPRKMRHRAELVMVYIRGSFRGTGLARNLLDAVLDFARKEGVAQIELSVSAENPAALRFYRQHGFLEIGCNPSGFLDDGREIAEIRMMSLLGGQSTHVRCADGHENFSD